MAASAPRATFEAMWEMLSGPELVDPVADHRRLRFVVGSEQAMRQVHVEISGTAAASSADTLASPIREAVLTDGRDALERYIAGGDPPPVIRLTTTGIWPSIAPEYA
jgi:hypothetical protein